MQRTQQAAAEAVQATLSGRNLDAAIEAALRAASLSDDRQAAAVRAYSYGTLRHLGFLRFALDKLIQRKPHNDKVVALLLVALYQLEYGKAPDYAVVDHAVKCVEKVAGRGMKPFANAVLREYQRKRKSLLDAARCDDTACWSYPRWWIDKLRQQLGPQAAAVLALGNAHPPMTLRVNRRRIDPAQYLPLLERAGIGATLIGPAAIRLERPLPVQQLPGFADGMVSVQDAGAQQSAPLLDLSDGLRVLDACAAPGGKAGHMLELADVELICLDQDATRLERVADNLQRLHLSAQLRCADAADLQSWWDGNEFGRVLLDAPCSASGVVRRHPDIKWLRREQDVSGFAQQQRRLLEALWQVVAGGGKLLYVTCSIFREENQQQVDWFLSRHGDARLAPRHAVSGGELLLPSEDHDGFFHALFEKA